jgi:hypothetical protein
MCIIFVCDGGSRVPNDDIELAWQSNMDGAGMGWADGEAVHAYKGYTTLADLLPNYAIMASMGHPHVLHLRLASSGGDDALLTHPYIVRRQSPLQLVFESGRESALYHNGHWSEWETIALAAIATGWHPASGRWNDSRMIAHLVAIGGKHLLDDLIPGKFALLTKNGIETFGTFERIAPGILASNTMWQYRRTPRAYQQGGHWDMDTSRWVSPQEEAERRQLTAALQAEAEGVTYAE